MQAFLLALRTEGIEGETFMIAMNDPFDYVEAAAYAAKRLGIETLDLVDPVGQDFCIDTTKARYVLGYQPQYDIFRPDRQGGRVPPLGRRAAARVGIQGVGRRRARLRLCRLIRNEIVETRIIRGACT